METGKESIACTEGTGEVASSGEGLHCKETNNCNSKTDACFNVHSSQS